MLCVTLLFPGTALNAQVQTGLDGAVTDSSGAVIQGAQISVANAQTGVTAKAVSSSAGAFNVVGLIPGDYTVTVEAPGFKTFKTQLTVEVAKVSSINVRMTPGATSETVSVKEADISLNTSSPGIGTTVEPELIKNAPIEINGLARQVDSFMYLAPGVQGNATSHVINGGVSFENDVQFNGVPVAFVQFEGNQTYINPPYEAVSEFRVESATFDPQFGLGQGAVTFNMASGTNDLHGDAFEILRNQWFDSDGFFPVRYSADGKPEPPIDQQNNYGFTVGGPVVDSQALQRQEPHFFPFQLGPVQAKSGSDQHWNRADSGDEGRRLQQFRGYFRQCDTDLRSPNRRAVSRQYDSANALQSTRGFRVTEYP